ncbi:MAG: hypothetical protein ABR570_01515 [Burkholderiales bacterium]
MLMRLLRLPRCLRTLRIAAAVALSTLAFPALALAAALLSVSALF